MNLVKVIGGQIVAWSLPEVGELKDGSTVSGYNLLPPETLADEGWLPLVDEPPTYDPGTHHLEIGEPLIEETRVVRIYRVVENKPVPPSEVEFLKAEVAQQNQTMSELLDLLFTHVPELSGL